jgi:NAD(P)H-flavin reductase
MSINMYKARVSDKLFLTDNGRFVYLKFELIEPNIIEFEAGQYVSIKINEQGERRSYSIVSTPDDNHGFHLVVEVLSEGRGSRYLQKLEIGAEVEVLGPMGKFTVTQSHSDTLLQQVFGGQAVIQKLLFVGTGTGIVPLWSMINDLLINKKETRQMRLHWGMRSEEDLFWLDELEQLSEEHPNFVYDIVLSKPKGEWELCSGHVQDCLARDFGSASSPQVGLAEWEGYVCGRPETVAEIVTKLKELGMSDQNVYSEKFN